jgi:uncharacterized membrane protein YdjX (TVP38/TMEM64 family)
MGAVADMKQVASVSSRSAVFRTLVVWALLTMAVLIPFFFWADDVQAYFESLLAAAEGNRALVALILFAVLVGDLFLPVPSCLVSSMCGMFLGAWLGFGVSFAAMTASSLAGFLIGRFAAPLGERILGDDLETMERQAASRNAVMLFFMRPVPVLAECSCVYAGLKRYPWGASVLWMIAGNVVVSAVYAVIGSRGRADDSFVPAFAAVAVLSGLGFLWQVLAKFGKISSSQNLPQQESRK